MLIFTRTKTLSDHISVLKTKGKTIGFSPTMGALHNGHMSLIKQSAAYADINVCSIFVNPTQFNEKSDLKTYPKTIAEDLKNLSEAGCNIVYLPSVEEVYPAGLDTEVKLDLGQLASVMEGAHRPGHFEGMLQVVKRLLDIVAPNFIFMGQKDFQQQAIVAFMLRTLDMKTELIACPIIRTDKGLAMSSRNLKLTNEDKENALAINQTLSWIKQNMSHIDPKSLSSIAMNKLKSAGLKPEYVNIVDGDDLADINEFDAHNKVVVCAAAWAGNVRLIDNMILK